MFLTVTLNLDQFFLKYEGQIDPPPKKKKKKNVIRIKTGALKFYVKFKQV